MGDSGKQADRPPPGDAPAGSDTPTRLSSEQLSSNPSQPMTLTPAAVQEGSVLADRYRVLHRLGKGGMGEVYLAEHIAIGRKVAIKTLTANLHDKPELARRFLQEARTASLVRHPNIVDITDFGHTDHGSPFFVMEYLEGEDLKALLRREGTLPWPRARDIALQVCAALSTAHRQGVVHRDMKPDNVYLIRQGQAEHVKVLDFGIAKIASSDVPQEATQTGVLLGTPEYMSPEQAQDLPLDARSDIYATGVILYRMLVGRVPFQSKSFMTVLARHIQEQPLPPRQANPTRGITEAQEAVVLRCLAKRPEDRYQSADELAAALRAVDDPTAAAALVPGKAPAPRRWLAPVLTVTALAVAVAGFLLLPRSAPQDMPDPPATPTAEPPAPQNPTPIVTPPPADPPPVDPPPTEPATTGAAADPPVPETSLPATPNPEKTKGKPRPTTAKTSKLQPVASLADADLKAAAASIAGALKECSALGIAGTSIKVDFEVGTDGKVTAATSQKPIHGSALGNCVEKAARRARFPPLTSSQRVTIPLRLPTG